MYRHLGFFRSAAAPRFEGRERLLFLLRLEPTVAARVETVAKGVQAEHGLRSTLRPNELLHVTLDHLGDYSELNDDLIESAIAAGDQVHGCAFEMVCDRVGTLMGEGRSAVVLHAKKPFGEVGRLRESLKTALVASGLPSRATFNPHVTMFYDYLAVPDQRVEPVSWTVRGFQLVHSWLGRTRYDVLASWTLGTGPF